MTVHVKPGQLYVVASPIGNLGDITLRALEVLRQVSVVAAEDTRHTRALLTHHGIGGKKMSALHAHSTDRAVNELMAALAQGDSVALLSDAGTPLVNDPGDVLVRAAIDAGHDVVPLPGPSAVLAALVGSGLGGAGFRYFGFAPREGARRREVLETVRTTEETCVLFESPQRIADLLSELAETMPTRQACVARELTKLHEQYVRGTLLELARPEREWRGEIVLVLGAYRADETSAIPDQARLDARIDEELARGTHPKTIADMLAPWSHRPRREVYALVVARKQTGASRA